ncbi:hypothetical protein BRAO375_720023 [Bradyrhizobium sp. ORS 375]|nr:hypothetical protein BRAO375_720023 [Bradyrhizobium sp. ORS 375]
MLARFLNQGALITAFPDLTRGVQINSLGFTGLNPDLKPTWNLGCVPAPRRRATPQLCWAGENRKSPGLDRAFVRKC